MFSVQLRYVSFMLSVIYKPYILSVVMLNVVVLSVVMLSVVMVNVVAPVSGLRNISQGPIL
jgi:hypothetical protein